MKLYLVRHAAAVEKSPHRDDGERYLTPEGRSFFRRTARRLRRKSLAPDLILTSPLVRAVQTAEILAEILGYEGELRVDDRLISDLSLAVLEEIVRETGEVHTLVLVGHNPSLAELAAELLGLGEFHFPKGGALALRYVPGEPPSFRWLAAGDEHFRSPGGAAGEGR